MELEASESMFEKPHIAEGLHHAVFVDLVDGPEGKYGERVIAEFMVYPDKEAEPVKLGRFFGKRLTPKSKLWEAMTNIGAKLEAGQKFDSDSLKGLPCRVVVEDYVDDEGKTCSSIMKVKEPADDTLDFIQEVKQKLGTSKEKQEVEEETVE